MGATVADPGAFRRRSRARLRPLPDPAPAPGTARRHAVGRRAADAGDRPRADEPAAAAAARRAVARPRAADREADLRGHPRDQRGAPRHRLPGRAERPPRAAPRPPRLCHAERRRSCCPGTGAELLANAKCARPISRAARDGGVRDRLSLAAVRLLAAALDRAGARAQLAAGRGSSCLMRFCLPSATASCSSRCSTAHCCRQAATRIAALVLLA